MNKYIGPHTGIAGGLYKAPEAAHALGATGFAMFTKNQRQWIAKPITPEESELFKRTCSQYGYTADMILPHDSYLINLAQPDDTKRINAVRAFTEELRRVEQLGLKYLNFHPGSGLGAVPRSESIKRIGMSVRNALQETETAVAVFENTAGQGDVLGCSIDELRDMIDAAAMPDRCGVCIDTCHAYAAGIDLSDEKTFDTFWQEFDQKIGMNMLCGMHINDSKGKLASHLDRHHSLGEGFIGWGLFERIARDGRFDGIPLVLETPVPEIWAQEIRHLKDIAG